MKSSKIIEKEAQISKIAGATVELTIRGERSFTFSLDEVNEKAAAKIAKFFEGQAAVSVTHDEECGSFVYVEV